MAAPTPAVVIAAVSALVASAVLTAAARKVAVSSGLIDLPNARSSHIVATPRGGGVAIVLSATVTLLFLRFAGQIDLALCWALVGGGAAVAAIGFADDRHTVSAVIRLLVHVAAAVWAVVWIGGVSEIAFDGRSLHLGWVGNVLSVAGVVWAVNLFNFMDGIDGIAAAEATFVTSAATALGVASGYAIGGSAAALILSAACCGFLLWNWPPAKIFMGDVGSGYLGYVLAVLALKATRENPQTLWLWLILGGVFLVDATATLMRRLLRGERVYQAHRSHAYQWLARRWGSHRRVTVAVLLVNVFWLLPCAIVAALRPNLAAATALIALAPLVVLAIATGSGRPERPDQTMS